MGTKQFDNYADLITFTRASSATYLDSDGVLKTASTNIPRIEYDADGNRLGLLIEEQRTNLFPYSEDFSDSYWDKSNATVDSNTIIAPDGTLTGDKLVTASTSGQIYIRSESFSSATGQKYTMSAYFKTAGLQFIQMLTGGSISAEYVNFDVTNKIITAGTYTDASITDVGNGWVFCSFTFESVATVVNNIYPAWLVPSASSARVSDMTGDGTSGVYIWGAQLEAGSFPTSYIPTSGSTATRAADVASITGADFKKWFNADEGTLFVESTARTGSEIVPFMTIDNGATNSNEHRIMKVNATVTGAGDRIVGTSRVNGTVTSICAPSSAISGNFKASYGYKLNDFAASVNAATAVTDTSGVLPTTVDRLFIGTRAPLDSFTNGHIKSIKYYPRRLSNAQLQELTQ